VPEDSRRNKFQFPPVDVEKGYEVVDVLKEIGQNHGASPAQVAIAWILTKAFISSVIIGANKRQHLEDNLEAVKLHLSAHEIEQLNTLTAPQPIYPSWMQPMGWDSKVKAALDPESNLES
jgi:aryl-alcohol dehydrogenase-like predicted oxidoreductase